MTLDGSLTLYAQWVRDGDSDSSDDSNDTEATPAPTPAPAEAEAPLTETEKDALLDGYSDLDKTAWYRDGVAFVLDKGIMNGIGDGSFGPNLPASRAMIVTMLWRMDNEPAASGVPDFKDVEDGAWYADAVRWAASAGIVNGYSDLSFGPDNNVNREQLAAILFRYAKYKGIDVSVEEDTGIRSFGDASETSEWAFDAMRWTVGAGLVNGMDGTLNPKDEATRAQVAVILMRYLTGIAERKAAGALAPANMD